jgi:hypothetical protein
MNTRPDAVRLLQYAVSFVGLMVFLFAVYGLTALLLSQAFPDTRTLLSGSSLRQQVSYYLAALIVATPLWLFFWRLTRRRVERSPAELHAPERHLFLALTSAIGAVAALFALHTILRVLFSLPVEHDVRQVLLDGMPALLRLIIYGLAAFIAGRTAWRENRLSNPPQDLALFAVSGFGLVFLALGALDALMAILSEIMGTGGRLILGDTVHSLTLIWAQTAAWVVSGGVVWAAVTVFLQSQGKPRHFRLAYLYVVLAASVAMTVVSGTDMLYEILRRAFGYSTAGNWHFLKDTVPWLVVGATLWIYHWVLLRAQPETDHRATTLSPDRRLAISGYAFIGLAMAAPAAAVLLWLVLDWLFGTHGVSLSGHQWWVDRLSAGVALLAVGLVLWAPSWRLLQRAAQDPDERGSTERRWLVGATTLISALAAIGFTIAFLWTLLQALLGGGLGAGTESNLFKYLGTALIALAVVAYYGFALRADMRSSPLRRRARIVALVEPGGEPLLDTLRAGQGRKLQVQGYLTQRAEGDRLDLNTLGARLPASETDRVLVILGPDGALLLPYTRNPGTEPQPESPQNAALPAPGS